MKGKSGILVLAVLGLIAGAAFMKKKREQELDEALWEEPRNL